MVLNESKTSNRTLFNLRHIVNTPSLRAAYIEERLAEFVAHLPPTMQDAFRDSPTGTKADAVRVAIEITFDTILNLIAESLADEDQRRRDERTIVVHELSDTLEGPDFDPDFKEPVPT